MTDVKVNPIRLRERIIEHVETPSAVLHKQPDKIKAVSQAFSSGPCDIGNPGAVFHFRTEQGQLASRRPPTPSFEQSKKPN